MHIKEGFFLYNCIKLKSHSTRHWESVPICKFVTQEEGKVKNFTRIDKKYDYINDSNDL